MPGKQLSMTEKNPHQDARLVREQAERREMVEKHGEQHQIERYYAGLLPDDELIALARRVLYAPLDGFRRYQNVQASRRGGVGPVYLYPEDVKHTDGCPGTALSIRFFTRPPDNGITGDEWRDFRRIHDALEEAWRAMPTGVHATVELIEHVGICGYCRHREAIRRSASVRIDWAGLELVREYALGGAQ